MDSGSGGSQLPIPKELVGWSLTAARWLVSHSSKLNQKATSLKTYWTGDTLRLLHEGVAHSVRDFSEELVASGDTPERYAIEKAAKVCTDAQRVMCNLLGTGENELHCCLKGYVRGDGDGDLGTVATWARSEPGDDRPYGLDDSHSVEGNTVWCSLLGEPDRYTHWLPFNCFVCNDLTAHIDHFACTREGWPSYYKSALVYPLNVTLEPGARRTAIGFLAFDSPRVGIFKEFPDIFAHRDGGEAKSAYKDQLNRLAVFHAGAMVADMLSTAMRPFYSKAEVKLLTEDPRS